MNKILLTIILSSLSVMLIGQNTILQIYFESVSSGRTISIPKTDMASLYANDQIIDQLANYYQDPALKPAAVRLLGRIGNKHQNISVKQASIHQLLDFASDNDPKLQPTIIDKLINFKKETFDKQALLKLDEIVRNASSHIKEFVLLAGFLGREPLLKELSSIHKDNKKTSRNIGLALSRCGDRQRLQSLLKSLETVEKDDVFVHQIVSLLIYTRQKESFDYLLDLIQNDQKNCTAGGDHRSAKVICGYRIMEMIAPFIVNFPIEVDEYGEAIMNDYENDLTKVRTWIKNQNFDYQLVVNVY